MDPQANLSSEPIACNLTNVSVQAAGRCAVYAVIVVTLPAAYLTSRFGNQLARELEPLERMAARYVDNEA